MVKKAKKDEVKDKVPMGRRIQWSICTIDIKDAYNMVNRKDVIKILRESEISIGITKIINDMLHNTSINIDGESFPSHAALGTGMLTST